MPTTAPIPEEPDLSHLVEEGLVAAVAPQTTWRVKMETAVTQLGLGMTNVQQMLSNVAEAITGDPKDRTDLGMKGDISFLKTKATEHGDRLDRLCTRVDALERTPGQKAEQRMVDWAAAGRMLFVGALGALFSFVLLHVRFK